MNERRDEPDRPPHAGCRRLAQRLGEHRLEIVPGHDGAIGNGGEAVDELIGPFDAEAGVSEAPVVEAGRSQQRQHRGPERCVVIGGHGVEREPHQRALHDPAVRERVVELGRIEALGPVPERQVGRRRLLGLEPADPLDGIDDVDRPAVEEELTIERGPVELLRRERHTRQSRTALRRQVACW